MTIPRIAMMAALLLAVTATRAAQTTYYVNPDCGDDAWSGLSEVCASPDGPKKTIQPAIDATAVGDTVVLADGTYYMTETPITFGGKDITLRSANGPTNCVIDGQDQYQAIYIVDGETNAAVIDGITFQRCFGAWTLKGGAIRIVGAGPTIENCVFKDNDSGGDFHGGAIYISESPNGTPAIIVDCEFYRNHAGYSCHGYGGAVAALNSFIEVYRCQFVDNFTSAGQGGGCHGGTESRRGAAIYLDNCESSIKDCVFKDGKAQYGGGAYVESGRAVFERCAFERNDAHNSDEFTRGSGGALASSQAVIVLADCLISSNTAGGFFGGMGGGVSCGGGLLKVTNCTFVNNIAYVYPDGNYGGAVLSSGSATIENSVFWGNSAEDDIAIWARTGSIQLNYALVEKGELAIRGSFNWNGPRLDQDPGFVDPQSDFRPDRNSLLIDAGDSSVVTIPPLPAIALDLDGNPRLLDDPGTPDTGAAPIGLHVVDIGCYEFQGSSCAADCDWSTGPGVLDIFDFLCFQNAYVSGEPLACDCDTSTGIGVCDIFDFLCFQSAFVQGCPP